MFRKIPLINLVVAMALLVPLLVQPGAVSAHAPAAPLASGRTITVTTTQDDLSNNGNCTLREAIQAANLDKAVDKCTAGSGTDTIKLGAGTYKLAIAGNFENVNLKGDLDVFKSLMITGVGIDKTIIDGGRVDRIFDLRLIAGSYALSDLTLQNGLTSPRGIERRDDGGAVANKGKLTVNRVRFSHNRVEGVLGERGGAIFSAGSLLVNDSFFENNSSESGGGAITNTTKMEIHKTLFKENFAIVGGAILSDNKNSDGALYDVQFSANTNGPGTGAAIAIEKGGKLYVKNALFEGNGQTDGAIVYNKDSSLTIRNTTFRNNDINGGIVLSDGGTLKISYSTIDSNTTPSLGPLVVVKKGTAYVDRMTFSNNLGEALQVSGGSTRLTNSTLVGLTQAGCAGAVCVTGGELAIESVTISGNRSTGDGALVVNGGKMSIHNSIVSGTTSTANGAPIADCKVKSGTTTNKGYNLIGIAEGCGLTSVKGDQFGLFENAIDAKLDILKNNGGANQTLALLANSPAIDKADPANTLKTDQRNFIRPAGRYADIGAFELNSKPATGAVAGADLEPTEVDPHPFLNDAGPVEGQ